MATLIVLIPFITLASNIEQINKLMDRIKNNSESYRLICYRHPSGNWSTDLELNNKKEYCSYLKNVIEHDVQDVLELEKEDYFK